MSQPFIGQIRMMGCNYPPFNHAFCNGQIMSIAQNSTLFALLGTTYGGDGQNTFALPNFQGRLPIHQGQGPGLSNYVLGQAGGSETVTLSAAQLPVHTHSANANSGAGGTNVPTNGFWAQASSSIYSTAAPATPMNAQAVGTAGGSQPHENMMPFLAINFVIALFGIFPSRN